MAIHYLRRVNVRLLRGTALLRLDFNTEDDWRMRAVVPTITFLLKHADKIVIVSHKGRPEGYDEKFSLRRDAAHLAKLLKRKIQFVDHFRFAVIQRIVADAPRGSIILLENLRFLKQEENNDPALAHELALLADYYVNDAFAVCHRANTSVVAITKMLPSYAGFELEREIKSLSRVMVAPKHPLVFVLGGAKAADKLGVIQYFKKKADWFLLGGGPANTMLSIRGMDIKKSIVDSDAESVDKLKALDASRDTARRILLPTDFVWSNDAILDFGPKSILAFSANLARAKTIVWSGPLGLIEKKRYARASILIAKAIAKNRHAFSVAGGGETVMFLKKYKLDNKFGFISTGGGAMLDFLAGKKLPGIVALQEKH